MTKRRRRRSPKVKQLQLPSFHDQVQCSTCQRYRMRRDDCWFCNPPWPDPCLCDDVTFQHVHLEHELLERLSQLDYESIDETILLPTENWPTSPDDVLDFEDEARVGVEVRGETEPVPMRYKPRIDWREQPEYKAFLATNPELREKAKKGIDAIFGYFGLTSSEADVWAMDAAGYTPEYIADRLTDPQAGKRFKPGGVVALLESVHSKVAAKMRRSAAVFSGAA